MITRVKVFRINDKYLDYAKYLIKERQKVWNGLCILYNNEDDDMKKVITSYMMMRSIYAPNSKSITDDKKLKLVNHYHNRMMLYLGIEYVFRNFYNTFSNKLFVDIIKEFNANVKVAIKLENKKPKNLRKKIIMKQIKLRRLFKGSITFDSNILKYEDYYVRTTVFNINYQLNKFGSKNNYLKLSINTKDIAKPKNLKLVWKLGRVYAHVTYEKDTNIHKYDKGYNMSIDPGQDNYYTIFSDNPNAPSLLLRNDAINRYNRIDTNIMTYYKNLRREYNKHSYYGRYAKINNTIINHFDVNRSLIIRNEFHKMTNRIVDYVRKYKITKVIIGRNKHQKNKSSMNRKNNRKFHNIPHYKLNEYLEYKLNDIGIDVVYQEESYTSKVSSLNSDVNVWEFKLGNKYTANDYLGVRLCRSVYLTKTNNGQIVELNADINGAINILQKHIKSHINIDDNWNSIFHPITIRNDKQFLDILV